VASRFKQHLRKYDESKTVKWFDATGLKVMNRSQLTHDTVQWPYFVNRRMNHRVSMQVGDLYELWATEGRFYTKAFKIRQ
jgi:hypothetical protein